MIREYGELDATALADLVRRGEVSSLELLGEAIRRLEQVNGVLNAVTFRPTLIWPTRADSLPSRCRCTGVPAACRLACILLRGWVRKICCYDWRRSLNERAHGQTSGLRYVPVDRESRAMTNDAHPSPFPLFSGRLTRYFTVSATCRTSIGGKRSSRLAVSMLMT